jgi:hypothetical protein
MDWVPGIVRRGRRVAATTSRPRRSWLPADAASRFHAPELELVIAGVDQRRAAAQLRPRRGQPEPGQDRVPAAVLAAHDRQQRLGGSDFARPNSRSATQGSIVMSNRCMMTCGSRAVFVWRPHMGAHGSHAHA